MSDQQDADVPRGGEDGGSSQLNPLVIEILQKARRHPVLFKALNREIARRVKSHRAGLVVSVLENLVGSGLVLDLGNGEYFLAENIESLKDRVCAVIKSHHARYPYELGMGTSEIKKRFAEGKTLNARKNIDPRLFDLAMSACRENGLVEEGNYGVRLSGFTPLTSEDAEIAKVEQAILGYIDDRYFSRTNIVQLARHLDIEPRMARAVIWNMQKNGKLIRVTEGRYYIAGAIEDVKSTLVSVFKSKARLRIAEITKALDLTRSKAIPLLEYFDEIGFTRRYGDFRSLVSPGPCVNADSEVR